MNLNENKTMNAFEWLDMMTWTNNAESLQANFQLEINFHNRWVVQLSSCFIKSRCTQLPNLLIMTVWVQLWLVRRKELTHKKF